MNKLKSKYERKIKMNNPNETALSELAKAKTKNPKARFAWTKEVVVADLHRKKMKNLII